MCEANAYYIDEEGKEEVLMKEVDIIVPDEEKYLIKDIYGNQKFIKGKIQKISLVDHKIIFGSS